jgi:hypothetical protein
MKKFSVIFLCALIWLCTPSCIHEGSRTSITISDADDSYYMSAQFSKSKTRDIEQYMDDRIGRNSRLSFVNTRIDGTITLDDHTTFYLKKSPGAVEIKLDKSKNSNESYHTIKSMCEEMKTLLARK